MREVINSLLSITDNIFLTFVSLPLIIFFTKKYINTKITAFVIALAHNSKNKSSMSDRYLKNIGKMLGIFSFYLFGWIFLTLLSMISDFALGQNNIFFLEILNITIPVLLGFHLFSFFLRNRLILYVGIFLSFFIILNLLDPQQKLRKILESSSIDLLIFKFSLKDLFIVIVEIIILYSLYKIWKKISSFVIKITVTDSTKQALYKKFCKYFGFFVSLIILLKVTGFDIKNFAIITGAVGIGIGFGLQRMTSNFFSGIIILFEKHIKIGDFINIPQIAEGVYVKAVGLRAVVAENFSGERFVIPNELLTNDVVKNVTHKKKLTKMSFSFCITYHDDIEKILNIAQNGMLKHDKISKIECPPKAVVGDIGDYGFKIMCVFWLDNINREMDISPNIIKSDLIILVQKELKANNIEMSTPRYTYINIDG